jgi:hypothetical protein
MRCHSAYDTIIYQHHDALASCLDYGDGMCLSYNNWTIARINLARYT